MGFEHQIAVYLKQYNNIIILMCIITNLCNVFCSMWTTRPFPNEFGHATASVYCSMWVLYFHLLFFNMTYSLNFYIKFNSIKIIFYTNIIFLLLHMYTLWEINKFKMRNNPRWKSEKEKCLLVSAWRPPELWPTVSSHAHTYTDALLNNAN